MHEVTKLNITLIKCSLTGDEFGEKIFKGKDKIGSLAGSSLFSDQRKQVKKNNNLCSLLYFSAVCGRFLTKISQIHWIFEFLSAPLNNVFLTIPDLVLIQTSLSLPNVPSTFLICEDFLYLIHILLLKKPYL